MELDVTVFPIFYWNSTKLQTGIFWILVNFCCALQGDLSRVWRERFFLQRRVSHVSFSYKRPHKRSTAFSSYFLNESPFCHSSQTFSHYKSSLCQDFQYCGHSENLEHLSSLEKWSFTVLCHYILSVEMTQVTLTIWKKQGGLILKLWGKKNY